MELTGSVMTLLVFLTYVTKQDHGVLLEVDVALKDHVPTTSPEYPAKAAARNHLFPGAEPETDDDEDEEGSGGGSAARATRSKPKKAGGEKQASKPSPRERAELAKVVKIDQAHDAKIAADVDAMMDNVPALAKKIFTAAKVHTKSRSGIEKLQAVMSHLLTSAAGKRRFDKEFAALTQDDRSLPELIEVYNKYVELYAETADAMDAGRQLAEFKLRLNRRTTAAIAHCTTYAQVEEFSLELDEAADRDRESGKHKREGETLIRELKAKNATLEDRLRRTPAAKGNGDGKASGGTRGAFKCYYCNGEGHQAAHCPDNPDAKKIANGSMTMEQYRAKVTSKKKKDSDKAKARKARMTAEASDDDDYDEKPPGGQTPFSGKAAYLDESKVPTTSEEDQEPTTEESGESSAEDDTADEESGGSSAEDDPADDGEPMDKTALAREAQQAKQAAAQFDKVDNLPEAKANPFLKLLMFIMQVISNGVDFVKDTLNGVSREVTRLRPMLVTTAVWVVMLVIGLMLLAAASSGIAGGVEAIQARSGVAGAHQVNHSAAFNLKNPGTTPVPSAQAEELRRRLRGAEYKPSHAKKKGRKRFQPGQKAALKVVRAAQAAARHAGPTARPAYIELPDAETCPVALRTRLAASVMKGLRAVGAVIKTILDSGANCHFVVRREDLTNYHKFDTPIPVGTAAQGATCQAIGYGDFEIKVRNTKGEVYTIAVQRAYHVPQFETNLISWNKLAKEGHRLEMEGDGGKLLIRGTRWGIPYTKQVLPLKFTGTDYQFVTATGEDSGTHVARTAATRARAETFHDVCHAGEVDMKNTLKFAKCTLPKGMTLGHDCKTCPACAAAKCTVADVNTQASKGALGPIQEVSFDFIVPDVKAASGESNALLARDAGTTFCWAFPTKSRSQAGAAFERWFEDVLSNFEIGDCVTCLLRVDNELSQPNSSFRRAVAAANKDQSRVKFKFATTAPNSSAQNGKVERLNRTTKANAHATMVACRIPRKLWPMALLWSCTTENMMSRGGQPSAWQQAFGQPPELGRLLNAPPLGTLVAVKKHGAKATDDKCRWGIFSGLSPHHPNDCISVMMPGTMRTIQTRSWRAYYPMPDATPMRSIIDDWRYAASIHGQPSVPETLRGAGGDIANKATPIETERQQTGSILDPVTTEDQAEGSTDDGQPQPKLADEAENETGAYIDTKWHCTTRDNATCRTLAKMFGVQPEPYLAFMREYDVFTSIHMASKLRKGTDVPDPNNNEDFERCRFAAQACRAALEDAGSTAQDGQLGGRSPTDKQYRLRADAAEIQKCKDDHFHKSLQDPRRPTFEIVPVTDVPAGKRIIRSGWTLNAVYDADGNFEKWKGRSYAHGQTQVEVEDFDPYGCSSVPARLPTIRLVLGIAAECNFMISQGDFTAAYLEAELQEEVYVELPPGVTGVEYRTKDGVRNVGRCKQSYFGLHQCGKNWELCLRKHVMSLDETNGEPDQATMQAARAHAIERAAAEPNKLCITGCASDPNLYIAAKKTGKEPVQICVFVVYTDDVLFASSCPKLRRELFDKMHAKYPFVDKGSSDDQDLTFCGCKIARTVSKTGRLSYTINQKGYVEKMLRDCQMDEANPVIRPTMPGQHFSKEDVRSKMSLTNYRKVAGGLLWAAMTCWPQMAAHATVVCRFMSCPTTNSVALTKRMMRYMVGNTERGIVFSCDKPSLENYQALTIKGFCDADWAASEDDARSTSGYVLMIANAAFDWRSRLQHTVAMSTAESECYALCAITVEAEFYRGMLREMGVMKNAPVIIGVDNKAAVLSAKNASGKRTRHVNIRFHRVREAMYTGRIDVQYVRGGSSTASEQKADIMTKSCSGPLFDKFDREIRGIRDG